MSHTPGPWTIGDVQWIMHRQSGLGYSYRPITAGTWELAQVWEDDCDREMSANVRLIAAAPDLLAACKRLLLEPSGRFVCYCHDPEALAVPCDNCAAAAAITKATGSDDWQD